MSLPFGIPLLQLGLLRLSFLWHNLLGFCLLVPGFSGPGLLALALSVAFLEASFEVAPLARLAKGTSSSESLS